VRVRTGVQGGEHALPWDRERACLVVWRAQTQVCPSHLGPLLPAQAFGSLFMHMP